MKIFKILGILTFLIYVVLLILSLSILIIFGCIYGFDSGAPGWFRYLELLAVALLPISVIFFIIGSFKNIYKFVIDLFGAIND